MSGNCAGSPCAFGCSAKGSDGYVCGCPIGYNRIGQVSGQALDLLNVIYSGVFV